MKYVIDINGSAAFRTDGFFISVKQVGTKKEIFTTDKEKDATIFTDLEKAKKVAQKLSAVGKIGVADVYEYGKTDGDAVVSYYRGKEWKD